jgi:PAS domain-containing protein
MNVSEAAPPMFASNVSAMLEPQAILKSVIAVYPVGVVIVDPLGNIILANGELERMFGCASDEIVGQDGAIEDRLVAPLRKCRESRLQPAVARVWQSAKPSARNLREGARARDGACATRRYGKIGKV